MINYQQFVLGFSLVVIGAVPSFLGGWKLGEKHTQEYLGEGYQNQIEVLENKNRNLTIAHSNALNNGLHIAGVKFPSASCDTALQNALRMVAKQRVTAKNASEYLDTAMSEICGIYPVEE